MAPRSATENRLLAEADKARKEAVANVTAIRRQLEEQGLKPKEIQTNPALLAAQAELEKAKSAAGLLTTQQSLDVLNKPGIGPKAADTRLAAAAGRRKEDVMAGFRGTPDYSQEQFYNSIVGSNFSPDNPPSVAPPPGYRWVVRGTKYPSWQLQASNEARERDSVGSFESPLGGGRIPWQFDPVTNSFVFRPTQFTPQSTIDQFEGGSTSQEVIGSTMSLPNFGVNIVDGGGSLGSFPIDTNTGGGNYTFEDVSNEPAVTGGGTVTGGNRVAARDSARLLAEQYGLGAEFFGQIEQFLYEDISEASLLLALRSTEAYKKRFAANAARVSKGLPALSEGEYIRMEQLYRQELRAAGLPSTFYDDLNDFKTYIENDISYNEFVGRVGLARRASQMANPEVKKQLKDLYGVAESDLVGYFLNPDKTRSMIERQFNVAQTAAALGRAGFGTTMAGELTTAITGGRPETVIDYGQLEAAAQTAGVARPLSQEVLGGEGGAVTEQDLLRGVIAEDVQSQRRIQREQQKRLAEYQAGGALMEGQQGVLGLRSAAR